MVGCSEVEGKLSISFAELVSPGTVCTWPAVARPVFPPGLLPLRLPALLLLPQQGPLELG